ncbi:MAG: flagellar basal body P-ring formation chaperone FlgA [Gallionella sp.]
MIKIFLLLWLSLNYTLAAATQQDHDLLRATVARFVKQQTASMGGKVAFTVDNIDPRVILQACNKLQAFLPTGSQLIGRVSVGVHCLKKNGWRIYIPVQIRITRDLLISAHSLMRGQIIHSDDLSRLSTETTQNIGMTDKQEVIGKVLRYSIAARYMLRANMLRDPYTVKQGQAVRIAIKASGFTLTSTGVAMRNASAGETVRVRTTSGRMVSGIADANGVVEITP